jgi:hypothetical protein
VKKLVVIPFLICTVALFGMIAACKQGEGERCQINDDCTDGLVCNQATQECARTDQSNSIDATVPIDGPPIDAAPDAPPDAPPDAN